jgi:hypothetical protein
MLVSQYKPLAASQVTSAAALLHLHVAEFAMLPPVCVHVGAAGGAAVVVHLEEFAYVKPTLQ